MDYKNIIKKVGIVCIATTMAIMPVSSVLGASYTAIQMPSDKIPTINKYLIMDKGDSVPNVSFAFSVTAGTAIPAQTEAWIYNSTEYATEAAAQAAGGDTNTITHREATMAVLAGPTSNGKPSIANIAFQNGATTYDTAQAGDVDVARDNAARTGTSSSPAPDAVTFTANEEKYAKSTVAMDFTGVTFPEPGIYRYVITETADTNIAATGITNDTDTDRILDVYVVDDGNGTLTVSDCVLHTNATTVPANSTNGSAGGTLADKTDGFTNEVSGTKDLVFKKEVSGNQASKDKYFKFTVTIGNLVAGNTYTVSIADDNDSNTTDGSADASPVATAATDATYTNMTNPTVLSVATGATSITQDFYLQHGQSIAIRGLPQNATYSVTETPEDYKSTPATVTGHTDQTATDSTNTTIGAVAGTNKVVKTSYTNTRNGTIPTGIISTIWGGILILAIGIAGFIIAMKAKRKKIQ